MTQNPAHAAPGAGDAGPAVVTPQGSDATGARVDWRGLWLSVGLLLVAFAPTLAYTVAVWWRNPDHSHGFLMPLVAAWLVWERRGRIRMLGAGTSLLAVPLLILCVLAMWVAQLDFMISMAPYAFVGAVGAVILAFFGWRGIVAFFPALVVLVLACPLPGLVATKLTLPLKEVSARLAVGLLHISGIPTYLDGNMIHLRGTDSLWVADACSGIRSLISLVSIAIVACLVWNRHWVLRILVVLAAVPIAVFVNGFRIWLTGYLSVHVSPEAASGAFHFFEGFALFALGGVLLLGFAFVLGRLFPRAES